MDFNKNIKLIACAFGVILFLCCVPKQSETTKSEFVLGTICTVTLFEEGHEQVLQEVFARLREIDNQMNVNLPASDISRLNAAAGIEPVQVHKDVFNLITNAFVTYYHSACAFDPTIGPVVALWDIGGSNPRVPSQQEIDDALTLVNWLDIDFIFETNSIFLKRPGMSLDLGAIAKGYAADEVALIMLNAGINRAIIDLGGNAVILGHNKNKPWKVGIQDPFGQQGQYIGIAEIPGNEYYTTAVTSGIYQRYFKQDGILYHHIISPFTGYPADSGLASVTIFSQNSMYADAYSTAIMVLGFEKGLNLINNMFNTEAVFIFRDGTVHATGGLKFTPAKK